MLELPLKYALHFQLYGRCKCCTAKLRHEMHAFNHWKKYHYEDVPMYFVFVAGQWRQCSWRACIAAMNSKQCWAITKPKNKIKES